MNAKLSNRESWLAMYRDHLDNSNDTPQLLFLSMVCTPFGVFVSLRFRKQSTSLCCGNNHVSFSRSPSLDKNETSWSLEGTNKISVLAELWSFHYWACLLAQKFQYWPSLNSGKFSGLALITQSLINHIECNKSSKRCLGLRCIVLA